MKCKGEATVANLGPFEDVRKLSATDNESLDMSPARPTRSAFDLRGGSFGSVVTRVGPVRHTLGGHSACTEFESDSWEAAHDGPEL